MPSRKRNKGKERRAKKAELKAEAERKDVYNGWRGWSSGDIIEGGIACGHGCSVVIPEDRNHPVVSFMNSFFVNWREQVNIIQIMSDTFESQPQVWSNERYREMAVNILVLFALLTDQVLRLLQNNISN